MDREHEIISDVALAKALVAGQFNEWSKLRVTRVDAVSTDNDMYRLGNHLALRLPKRPSAVAAIGKEHTWLSRLASGLPLQIPLPIAKGEAANGYPYPWSVVEWLEGQPLDSVKAKGSRDVARDLGRFITSLHLHDPAGGPLAGEHNHWRGAPLNAFDREMRRRFLSGVGLVGPGDIVEQGIAVRRKFAGHARVGGDVVTRLVAAATTAAAPPAASCALLALVALNFLLLADLLLCGLI